MSRIAKYTIAPLLFGLSAFCYADEAADVSSAIQSLNAAMLAGDGPAMRALTTDGLSYGHSDKRVQSQREFVDGIVAGKPAYRSIHLTDNKVSVVGTNAVARHHFGGTIESGGKTLDVQLEVLQVWQKQSNGRWVLIARQGYKP